MSLLGKLSFLALIAPIFALGQSIEAVGTTSAAPIKAEPVAAETKKNAPINAEAFALLEKGQSDLEFKFKVFAELKAKMTKKYEMNGLTLEKVQLLHSKSGELQAVYSEVISVWRNLADSTFDIFAETDLDDFELNEDKINDKIKLVTDSKDQAGLTARLKLLEEHGEEFREQVSAFREQILKAHFAILLRAGEARSVAINYLLQSGNRTPLEWSEEYFRDISREVTIIPYRFFASIYSHFLMVKSDIRLGVRGIIRLLKQLTSVFFLFVGILIVWLSFGRISDYLLKLRADLFRRSFKSPAARHGALWVERLRPFLPWALVLFGCWFSVKVLQSSYLADLGVVVPYLEIYAYYRVFRIFVALSLSKVSTYSGLRSDKNIQLRVEVASKLLGRFFLISSWFLYATKSSVSEGLVYILVTDFIVVAFLAVLLKVVGPWKEEIASILDEKLPGVLGKKWAELCKHKYGPLFCLPGAIVVFILLFTDFIFTWLQNFDFGKRIAAQIFRKQIEGADSEADALGSKVKLPAEYVEEFQVKDFDKIDLVSANKESIDEIKQAIIRWRDDETEEHSVAVCGEKGIGNTFLLKSLGQTDFGVEKYYLKVPSGLYKQEDVEKFFVDGVPSLKNESTDSVKRIIFVDEAQNLFLGKVGGFNGYKKFLEYLTNDYENTFWCVSFNRHAWFYINSVLSKARYFSSIHRLQPWSEDEIKTLILSRHKKHKLKLSFDEILAAAKIDDDFEGASYIESKFYRLLWEESEGNPRVALALWLTCLRPSYNGQFKVGLPKERSSSSLSALGDTTLFLLASILRHENLNVKELIEVTDFTEDSIRNSLKNSVELGVVWMSGAKSYRVSPLWLHPVTTLLERKNFIYGYE